MKINSSAEHIARSIQRHDKNLSSTRAQLSSGLKNPNPSTDPLASTISKRLSDDVASAKTIKDIVLGGKDMVETAIGVLQSNVKLLHNMNTLAVRASNGAINDTDREIMDDEFQQLSDQFQKNSNAQWGSRPLFDGTFNANYQTGIKSTEITNITINNMSRDTVIGDLTITDVEEAKGAISDITTSLNTIVNELARLGLYSQQFDMNSDIMATNALNLQESLSLNNDVDFAEAIADSTRIGVMRDAAGAALKMEFNDLAKLGRLVEESLHG